jgi:streptomycin 3"-adenylyltransferase
MQGVGQDLIDADVLGYSREVADRLASIVKSLVGVYLHGSAAFGDFAQGRSDIDILAVSSGALRGAIKQRLRDALSPRSLPCPGTGLEFSLVRRDSLRPLASAPPFELHIATKTRDAAEKFVDGNGHPGDPDLVLHYAVAKSHGVTLLGPPPSEVFPKVPRGLLLRALLGELEWAEANASGTYQVLTAARAWLFAVEDVICSKSDGANWARQRVDDPSVIDAALEHRRGAEAHPDEERARAFVQDVKARLATLLP